MKIFATSDLHIGYERSQTINILRDYVKKVNPDVVVISGDVYDYRGINPFYELTTLEVPVVFCLGNHEFAYRYVDMVHDHYKFNSRFDNVYCLDTKGHVDINGVRFVGNVLWYDGSLSNRNDVTEKLTRIIFKMFFDLIDAISIFNHRIKIQNGTIKPCLINMFKFFSNIISI